MNIFKAKSKINLYLKIIAKRPDSYHELESLFLPLDNPYDTLSFSEKNGENSSLEISGLELRCGPDNLCLQALDAYCAAAGIKQSFHIKLQKNIPLAAGLGGGSSDAAAVLKFLQNKYNYFDATELKKLAAKIGADVNFFLESVPAIARGIGEDLQGVNLDGAEFCVVLLNPGFPISTAWSYGNIEPKHIGRSEPDAINELIEVLKNNDLKQAAKLLRNDLAFAAYKKFPLLGMIEKFMLENGAAAAGMSGSGPTMFALCQDRQAADNLRNKAKTAYPFAAIW